MKHEILSAQLTPQYLTLTTTTGKILNVPQGRADLPDLVELCQTHLTKGETFTITEDQVRGIQDADIRAHIAGPLKAIEREAGGAIKFFRMARKVAARIFGLSSQTDGTFIRLDDVETNVGKNAHDEEGCPISQEAATKLRIQEVMEQATPITEEEVTQGVEVAQQTVVAVTDNGAMIGVEALEAALTNEASRDGAAALLKRMTKTKFEHTAQDVLSFLKRADLPLTINGDIIAYKRLNNREEGVMADCHSGTVGQRVGDEVVMPISKINLNRRQDCAAGLHIARRGYLGSFRGGALVICLIRPEDVIVVPHRTPDKVRVARYHIIHKVSESAAATLSNNRPMDPVQHKEDLAVVTALVNGWIPDVLGTVMVTGPSKEDVHYTPAEVKGQTAQPDVKVVVSPLDTSNVANVDADGIRVVATNAAHVDVASTIKKPVKKATKKLVLKGKIPTPTTKASTPRERIAALRPICSTRKATDAAAIKKAAKKSWEALGVSNTEKEAILALLK